MLTIWIGFDRNQEEAANVARASILRRASRPVSIKFLRINRLRAHGLYNRPTVNIGSQLHDVLSEAPMSTEFAISRFMAIGLNHQGAGLFMDCDVVCLRDICELGDLYDEKKAVQVVKHHVVATTDSKMDGKTQTNYQRKFWSSVFLFNSSHAGNRNLTLPMINSYPGRMLHRFCWLNDDDIGELPGEWNWLVGMQPKPANPGIAHFTLGVPNIPAFKDSEHSEIWHQEQSKTHAT